ncbi:MAG: xanthine dehydrogenase family protein molybdopterin-binding subunit [Dehalococcoidia bacterium]|nr:xanthine dehydrogenase family protein molybdopterin-binding subunit [Dehalococcoidia bacterium]
MNEHGEFGVIGKSVPKKDGRVKATGEAKFGADVSLPRMLYGALLRNSQHPHARIISIDTSAAEQLKGVRAVVTGKDFPGILYGNFGHTRDYLPLAIDRVRYIGEEVAAVAAEDEDIAEEALRLIKVQYEPLPAVFDPEEAMKDGAPLVYDNKKNNTSSASNFGFGDIENGFAGSDWVREEAFDTQSIKHGMIEPHACVGWWDADKATLWSCKQSPYIVWRQLAMALGLPPSKVRIIQTYVGAGNSGGKQEALPMDLCSIVLSRKTGRPVRFVHTMEEVLTIGHMRHSYKLELKLGLKKDGTIQAVKLHAIADGGAHSSIGQLSIFLLGMFTLSAYRIPNFRYDGYRIYTNKHWPGALRGHCGPMSRFAFEAMMDLAADDLGLSYVEIRKKNALKGGEVTGNGFRITTCNLDGAIDKVNQVSSWESRKGKMPEGRGIGFAVSGFPTGSNIMGHTACSAMLRVQEDGTVALQTGATDVGQGCDTVLPMIAAEVLGIDAEDVSFAMVDTDVTPVDPGTWSSRVTFYGGNAVKIAAQDAKNQIAEVAADLLEAKKEDLIFHNKRIYVQGNPDRGMALDKAIRHCQNKLGRPIMGRGSYNAPAETVEFSTGQGNAAPTYSFYAQVAEVAVDKETGKFDIVNVITAHDGGRELNPMLVEGQLVGSFVMHQGQASFEGIERGSNGQVLNPNFVDYRMVTAADVADTLSFHSVGLPDPEGPFGAKEAGEGASAPALASIANAVADAIGVRIKSLPITPDKILQALERQAHGQP